MMESAVHANPPDGVEPVLLTELANGDAVAATVAPILHHLLNNGGSSIFSDAVVAGVRGMLGDLTRQLLSAQNPEEIAGERAEPGAGQFEALSGALADNPALIGHIHALALEWQVTQQLQSRLSLDPVLTPLVQAQMSSGDSATAAQAMKLLAAQARYCQDQRRMKLPLTELPGDLLHGALVAMRTVAGIELDERAAAAESSIRAAYDEGRSRLGLAARLVTGMGGGGLAALSVTHSGVALFVTALALASGQDRDLAALSLNESQLARLALALRAAGLKQPAVEEQFLALHPDIALPEGFERLGADRAAALLASATQHAGR